MTNQPCNTALIDSTAETLKGMSVVQAWQGAAQPSHFGCRQLELQRSHDQHTNRACIAITYSAHMDAAWHPAVCWSQLQQAVAAQLPFSQIMHVRADPGVSKPSVAYRTYWAVMVHCGVEPTHLQVCCVRPDWWKSFDSCHLAPRLDWGDEA